MRYLASHERAVRGTFDFPIELYYVDKHHPRYEMPFHWHMEHELIMVLHGALHLSINGEACTLHEGDCLLIADGSIYMAARPRTASMNVWCWIWNDFCPWPANAASGWPRSVPAVPGWREGFLPVPGLPN